MKLGKLVGKALKGAVKGAVKELIPGKAGDSKQAENKQTRRTHEHDHYVPSSEMKKEKPDSDLGSLLTGLLENFG